ncbi:MAG: NAD(P)-binding domain-containing protein [Muribaculaceae bacterium]|nr:NAD(P)-binding domain-containing protein [Muribaculaceae bacterium]
MRISIIGAGAMGGAIALGLAESGFNPADIIISNPHEDKLKVFQEKGMAVTTDNKEACKGADLVFIAVKPWILPDVIKEIKDTLHYNYQAVSVIAAGISGADLKGWFDYNGYCPTISLSMPNTAVKCRESMTFIVPVTGNDRNPDIDLYRRLGEVKVIEERLLPAATSLASCGIAYALRYIRAATEGGVQLGFRASEAQEIVAQTVKGAALLLADGAHAEAEIDKVTTPGGLTIRGLNAMEAEGFTAAVIRGLVKPLA